MLKDNLRLGLLFGFIAPLIAMFLYYFAQFRNLVTPGEFWHIILVQPTLLTVIVSISLVANAAIFTYFINKRKDNIARGVFIATCIYGVASLVWKFLF